MIQQMKRKKDYFIQKNLDGNYDIMLSFTTVNAKIIATVETEEIAKATADSLRSLIKTKSNGNNNKTTN